MATKTTRKIVRKAAQSASDIATEQSREMALLQAKKTIETGLTKYSKAQAKAEKAKTRKAEEINRVNEKYTESINQSEVEEQQAYDDLKNHTMKNRDILFADGNKTVKTENGTVGIVKNKPRLVATTDVKLSDLTDALQEICPGALTVKVSVSEAYLLANMDNMPKLSALLEVNGIKRQQDERFTVNVKKRA